VFILFGSKIILNANHSYLRYESKFLAKFFAMHAPLSVGPHHPPFPLTLEKLSIGESGRVMAINMDGALKKRLFALGLKEGAQVRVLRRAIFGGPMHLRVGTSELIVRLKEASCICLATAS
jgi:ferrous iron transport protein A